jgi:carboxypeptidase family protein
MVVRHISCEGTIIRLGKAAFFLVLIFLLGCEGATKLEGRITDQDGRPIESAMVTLDVGDPVRHAETLSKADGSYYLFLSHAPGVARWVTVSKSGYKTVHKKLHGGIEVHLNVVLKRESVDTSLLWGWWEMSLPII